MLLCSMMYLSGQDGPLTAVNAKKWSSYRFPSPFLGMLVAILLIKFRLCNFDTLSIILNIHTLRKFVTVMFKDHHLHCQPMTQSVLG